MKVANWAMAPSLGSERLQLEPLTVEHADEMAPVLDDPGLHLFIGGRPATPEELGARYERLLVGHSYDGSERWLNWVIRRRDNGQEQGVATIVAHVHPAHEASMAVARAIGLVPTDSVVDGEVRWER